MFKRKSSIPIYPSHNDGSAGVNPAIKNIITPARIIDFHNKAPRLDNTFDLINKMAIKIPDIKVPGPPDPHTQPGDYLRSLHAVRQRSRIIFQKAKHNRLNHFDVDKSKFQDTVNYVVSIIKRDFNDAYHTIPPHGKWQHFDVGGRPRITQLLQSWPREVDSQERARRIVDLFVVSVLLDAGAGNKWKYKSKESGRLYSRSEGLAVAAFEMFKAGVFSSDPDQPHQVDTVALSRVTPEGLAKGLQVTEANPMPGVPGRASILIGLSNALKINKGMFGSNGRPGNMIDYLIAHPETKMAGVAVVPITSLWTVLMDGFGSIWPSDRVKWQGQHLGDAYPCAMLQDKDPLRHILPFHKLSQWLCYSIMVPMNRLANIHFVGTDLLTGLPEYRNGGLLIDTGVLSLKPWDATRGMETYHQHSNDPGRSGVEVVPTFTPSDSVIVEWRAVTIGFLDELLPAVNKGLKLKGSSKITLAQMLEAGTWKAGREIAEVSRPITRGPPIGIVSDGTVF